MSHEVRLTPDVPLGPFEGVPIKVYAAKGAKAKLHANERCSRVASATVTAREVKLGKDALAAMCTRCADYGSWEDRSTGAGFFLAALQGVGLLYQLASFTGSGEEEPPWERNELERAHDTLRNLVAHDDDDEDGWDQESAAREVRDSVVSEWRVAATSMAKAVAVINAHPWLREWARPKLAAKSEYLESVRTAARGLISPRDLCMSAIVATMDTPELPVSDPALKILGDATAIRLALQELWRRWSGQIEDEYGDHRHSTYLAHVAVDRVSSRSRARGAAIAKLTAVIKAWEADGSHAADTAAIEKLRTVTITLNEQESENSVTYRRASFGELTDWETAVVLTYQQVANWESRSFLLNVPPLVAERLLRGAGRRFRCATGDRVTEAARDNAATTLDPDVLGPGAFDDSRVADRRPITAADLKMYSAAGAPDEQLQLVFAPEQGVEVVTLRALRRRCEAGWTGVVIATEASLPASVIDAWAERAKSRAQAADPHAYPSHNREAPDYGAQLGILDGEDWLARLANSDRQANNNLRALALARSAPDLRTLADVSGERRHLHRRIWMAILSPSTIDFTPFRPVEPGSFRTGSGLPLGPLADVQIYASNLSGHYMGKSHSPFCSHSADEVCESDDMATLADLLRHEEFDPCSKCGGYAVRRLTEPQLTYYRCAHRVQAITKRWTSNPSYRPDPVQAETDKTTLGEVESTISELPGIAGAFEWRWREAITRLRRHVNES